MTTTNTIYEVHLDEKNGITKATIRKVLIPEDVEIMPAQDNCTYWQTKEEAEEWAKQYDLDRSTDLADLVRTLKTTWNNNIGYSDGIRARETDGITPAAEVEKVLEVLGEIVTASPSEVWADEIRTELKEIHEAAAAGRQVRKGKGTVDPTNALIDLYCQLIDEHRCRSAIHEVNVLRYWCFSELSLAEFRMTDGTEYNGGSKHD